MTLIYMDAVEPQSLDAIAVFTFPNAILHLYKNNYTPVDTSVLGNFIEANFSGYNFVTTAMGAAVEIGGKATSTDAAARLFTHNGGGTANSIYGYYVTDFAITKVVWAERFAAPISMSAVPDQISITLQLTLDSANH